LRAVARACVWFEELCSGRPRSIREIAAREGVTDPFVSRLLPLAFLAPEIVTAIVEGRQPIDLTTEKLIKKIDLPLDWTDQKRALGFA